MKVRIILLSAVFVSFVLTAATKTILEYRYGLPIECKICCNKELNTKRVDVNVEKSVIFTLFTRKNQKSPQTINFKDIASFQASHFNGSHPTRFIIHGYLANGESEINQLIRSAYIKRGNFNIIVVDWGEMASLSAYLCLRSYVRIVGTYVGKFIVWLNQISNKITRRTSVIGHSLGAHVAGFVGKHLIANNQILNTIVALDPPHLCFYQNNTNNRITSTDASYVEVIHTSRIGIHKPLATADFYPNWGEKQPACSFTSLLKSNNTEGLDLFSYMLPICSHSMAYRYFAESINHPKRFMSTKCANYRDITNRKCNAQNNQKLKMGGEPSNYGLASGIYYT